jgi:hypothetical protein
MSEQTGLLKALHSEGHAQDLDMRLYGWLIGDWLMDATIHGDDGATFEGPGEIHFGWVLAGRAIQDVWILPGVFHGTTLRIPDPALDAWHILWSDPVRQMYTRQLGRAQGGDIVQLGMNEGAMLRWSFTRIKPDSFLWLGERSHDDGAWQLQAQLRARRV